MKLRAPVQLIVGLAVLVIGAGALGVEYLLVKWYPHHQAAATEALQRLLPYRNEGLGIEMQIAAGIYGKVTSSPGGVRIYRSRLFGDSPSLTLTSQPNPDGAQDFPPETLARWETAGANVGAQRYRFEQTQINGRNAALVWQQGKKNQMIMTAHIISPDRIIQAECTPGMDPEDTYLEACDSSLHSIKIAGPPSPPPGKLTLEDVRTGHP